MPPAIYFLLHIPKTGGQTAQLHLEKYCAPGVFWRPPRNYRKVIRDGFDLSRLRAVSSHFIDKALEQHFAGREIRRSVLLRDPVELQLSLYNFRMMNYLAKGQGTYSFALHQRALPRNFIAHRLLSNWLGISWPALLAMPDAQKYDLVVQCLSDFWFVGSHAMGDELIAAIADDLGIPAEAERYNTKADWTRQVEWTPLTFDDLSSRDVMRLRSRNVIDQAIWESWRDRGFETGPVRAERPVPAPRLAFAADELLRPAFLAARFLRQERLGFARRASSAEADAAREGGNWAKAARIYGAVLKDMPNAPLIWLRYGEVLAKLGSFAEAEDAYRRAVELEPDRPYNRWQLAKVRALKRAAGTGSTVA